MVERWVAFHIFYYGDLDLLLARCLRPMLSALRRTGSIRHYFFVRYWNGGPHIRLRIAIGQNDQMAVEQTTHVIDRFLAENPGGQLSAEAYSEQIGPMVEAEATLQRQYRREPELPEPLQPRDSIQIRPYDFDVQRYGSLKTREIVETHFCRSSEMALFSVAQTLKNLPARLNLSLHMAATAIGAMDLSFEEAATLFERTSRAGLTLLDDDSVAHDFDALGFPSFEEQRSELEDLLFQLRNPLPFPGQAGFVNNLLQSWQGDLQFRWSQLQAHYASGDLPCNARYIIMDFLHMLNNRLGINLRNECYLYHLISRALQELEMPSVQAAEHACRRAPLRPSATGADSPLRKEQL